MGVGTASTAPRVGVPDIAAWTLATGMSKTIAESNRSASVIPELNFRTYALDCVYIVVFVRRLRESVFNPGGQIVHNLPNRGRKRALRPIQGKTEAFKCPKVQEMNLDSIFRILLRRR